MRGRGVAERTFEPGEFGCENILDARHLTGERQKREIAVGHQRAVGQHEDQQSLAADEPLADDLAFVPDVFENPVERPVERFVVERRHPGAERGVPGAGKVAAGFVAAQRIGAVGRHRDMIVFARGADAAGHREGADEIVLLGGSPAIVAVARLGGHKIRNGFGRGGGGHRTFLSNQPTSLWRIWFV